MATPKPRVKVPKTASPGDVVLIKALLSHPMESGLRKDKDGRLVPRRIVNAFACTFGGRPVFACDIEPAVSANPYFEFHVRIDGPGVLAFRWVDDDGTVYTAEEGVATA
jgi:sulfur-oxidizing protein SoxZ